MTIMLKNVSHKVLEMLESLKEYEKDLEIEKLADEAERIDKESFHSLSAFMREDLQKEHNHAVFERLKEK